MACLGLTASLRIFNDSIRSTGARLDGAGAFTQNLRIPNRPNLLGLAYYLQGFVRDASAPNGFAFSNGLTLLVGSRGAFEFTPGGLPLAKAGATANRLGDGTRVFVAGGGTGSLLSPLSVATTEIFDANTKDFVAGPVLSVARALHTATTLADGRVLVAGGLDAAGFAVATAEVYDPATNAFTPTGSMGIGRAGHVATLLPDGRVLVAGGSSDWTDQTSTFGSILDTAELWNPGTGTFAPAGNAMRSKRLAGAALTLADGRALVTGGFSGTNIFSTPTITDRADFFSFATNLFSSAGSMQDDRTVHTLTLLPNGRVLAAGGASGLLVSATASAELFDPAAVSWTLTGSMAAAKAGHRADLLASGEVLVTGGLQGSLLSPVGIANAEVFTGAGFAATGAMNEARGGHMSALLPNGTVMVVGGGPDGSTSSSTAEIFVR